MPDNGLTIDGLNSVSAITANDEIPVWDAEAAPNEPTKKITGSNLASSIKTLGSLLGTSDVVDSLTSTATDKPGSANMLKTLNGKISNLIKQIDYTGTFAITTSDDGRYYAEISRATLGIPNATLLFAQFSSNFSTGEFLSITSASHNLFISAGTSRTVKRSVRVFYLDEST